MPFHILHIGVGNVGREVLFQILSQKQLIQKKYGIDLTYSGLFTARNGFFSPKGLPMEKLTSDLASAPKTVDIENMIMQALDEVASPFVLIDTTASDKTMPFLEKALQKGGFVVMSNKKPISGAFSDFEKLMTLGENRLFFETAVGAGLPVIQTILNLLASGDEVIQIQGCFSGTLGYVFSQLDSGKNFSEIVRHAKALGYTEPDPRDDLSGVDVARKALILARLIGQKKELTDIPVLSLYPKDMEQLPIDAFMQKIILLDREYMEKVAAAKKTGKVLRYVATVTQNDCQVRLEAVEKTSDIGSLSGPDNIISITTKRYSTNPLVIKGPGAGIAVTAAGVFSDVLTAARLCGGVKNG